MYRFFCRSLNIFGDKFILDDKQKLHHLKDVLRLRPKDRVVIFDERGSEYNCIIEKISDKVELHILSKQVFAKKQGFEITLACAIPKKPKFDEIVDKLTQLGVDKIIPLLTKRVIVKWDKQKQISKLKRWQKLALSAAEQAQRSYLPILESPKDIKEVLAESQGFDLKLIPTLTGSRKTIKEILSHTKPKNILILIGPEGDFTAEEVRLAIKADCIPITLGETVLRVDTAAVAVVSFIKLYAHN
ncbi:MAG: 16S rRNA (uracil(1498)-N(3))-methyltransferase [Candidatus Omnitrophica bacterium]|nr:16S rRNA (uracil(1498)-N(3))-methyltransferase [Candidatus Omnitrophota bacterium]